MAQMRSRREQVDAHRFITSRMNQALVIANPDSVERPLRRIGVSIFASVMVMVLIFGGFAIAALFNKGNDEPMANHIIFEKGTNAIYVYTTVSGGEPTDEDPLKLWPVANYTSALMLLQPYQGEPPTQSLKPESLEGKPQGFFVGIDGAPPSPPPASSLLQDELWNVCSMPVTDGSSLLLTQVVVAEAEDLPAPEPLAEQWLFAETAEGAVYLLTNDRRYRVADEDFFNKLGLSENDVVSVKKELIDTVTPGPDLAFTPRTEFGDPSGIIVEGVDLKYGQTVVQGTDFYVLIEEDGTPVFAKISDVMRALMEPVTGFGQTIQINSTLLTEHGAQGQYETGDFPRMLEDEPRTVSGERPALCTTFDPAAEAADAHMTIGVYDSAPKMLTDHAQSISTDNEGNILANGNPVAQTVLPPGNAALVSPQQQPGQTVASVMFLIHNQGYKYGIKDSGTAYGTTKALLGYGEVEPVGVPESVLSLVQAGPVLDPVEARSELDPSGDMHRPFDSGEEEPEGDEEGEDGGE